MAELRLGCLCCSRAAGVFKELLLHDRPPSGVEFMTDSVHNKHSEW